jgi:hypothetical protein
LYYFHKKLKIEEKKTFLVGFLRWFFWGFFGWVFYCQPWLKESVAVAAAGAVEARGEEEGRKRKFGPIWMIPHLVKGLRFLQTKILQVREIERIGRIGFNADPFQHFKSLLIRIQFRVYIPHKKERKNQIAILLSVGLRIAAF